MLGISVIYIYRSILNCQVRYCNKIIKDLKSQINKIQDKIKTKLTNKDFEDITNQIAKTKERGFKTTQHVKSRNSTS